MPMFSLKHELQATVMASGGDRVRNGQVMAPVTRGRGGGGGLPESVGGGLSCESTPSNLGGPWHHAMGVMLVFSLQHALQATVMASGPGSRAS